MMENRFGEVLVFRCPGGEALGKLGIVLFWPLFTKGSYTAFIFGHN